MKFDAKTPRNTIKIAGVNLTVPQPYAEGHTLTANEAAALNQVLAENIRNNTATKIKEASAKGTSEDQMQAEVDAYVAGYEFGVRTGGGRTSDPVEREAMELARQAVRNQLQKKGHKLSEFSGKDITAYAAKVMENEQHRKTLMDKAKKIVAQRESGGIEGILE